MAYGIVGLRPASPAKCSRILSSRPARSRAKQVFGAAGTPDLSGALPPEGE